MKCFNLLKIVRSGIFDILLPIHIWDPGSDFFLASWEVCALMRVLSIVIVIVI